MSEKSPIPQRRRRSPKHLVAPQTLFKLENQTFHQLHFRRNSTMEAASYILAQVTHRKKPVNKGRNEGEERGDEKTASKRIEKSKKERKWSRMRF